MREAAAGRCRVLPQVRNDRKKPAGSGEAGKEKNKTKYLVLGVIATVFAFAAGLIVWNLFLSSRVYDQRIEIAEEYSRDKDYDKALVAYAAACDQDPENEEAYVGMCNVYMMQDEDAKAAAILQIGEAKVNSADQIQDKKQELSEMNGSEILTSRQQCRNIRRHRAEILHGTKTRQKNRSQI